MKCKVLFFIVVFLFVQTIVKSQEPVGMVAKFTESELSVVLPILKAEVAGITKAVEAYASETDAKKQLYLDLKSGKIDPLDWLKQHSKHILVPPGAKYEPACSRAVSLGGRIYDLGPEEVPLGAAPTAIFTLGQEIHSVNKQILGGTITQESFERLWESTKNLNEQDYADIKTVFDKVIGFYINNGFISSYALLADGYSRTLAEFYHPEDEGYITGNIYHVDLNLYNPEYPDNIKQCRQHPIGPTLEIKAEYKLIDKLFSSSDFNKTTDENTKNSLRKAGISEDRYALIKSSLCQARTDSGDPDAIEVPEFDFVPTTEDEKETAMIITQMKTDALARKSNALIYLKFKAELDPILDNSNWCRLY
jgi:hypothetical protein